MPDIDEFPRPAQAELRAQRGEQADIDPPEKRKGGLLRRLAAVGLGRRADDAQSESAPTNVRPGRPSQPRPADRMPAPPPRPAVPAPSARGPDPVSEYAKRAPHQALDPLGRQAPVHNEEDQLDIPAFLRRQAN
jgi:cell division protein FtsZ